MYIDRQVGLGCRRQLSRKKKKKNHTKQTDELQKKKNKQCRTEQQQKSLEIT